MCWHKWSKWSIDDIKKELFKHGEETRIVQVRKCEKCNLLEFKTTTIV